LPYAIVGGSIAEIIKYRYPADVVEKMLSIAWWDWEDSKIREVVPLLSSDDIQSFIKKYSPKDL
jgi:virginiamycin A acetyltransferase